MRMVDEPSKDAKFHAVRGPITRDRVLELGGQCDEVYGDPALLLPRFYLPSTNAKSYRVGIIPHYVDYDLVNAWFGNDPDIKVINLLNSNIESVIDDITQCENVVSSSLHGIIAAQVYGVNAHWVKFSDKLKGDGTKFQDYFASVKIEMEQEVISTKPTHKELLEKPYIGNIDYNGDKLLEAFPYGR